MHVYTHTYTRIGKRVCVPWKECKCEAVATMAFVHETCAESTKVVAVGCARRSAWFADGAGTCVSRTKSGVSMVSWRMKLECTRSVARRTQSIRIMRTKDGEVRLRGRSPNCQFQNFVGAARKNNRTQMPNEHFIWILWKVFQRLCQIVYILSPLLIRPSTFRFLKLRGWVSLLEPSKTFQYPPHVSSVGQSDRQLGFWNGILWSEYFVVPLHLTKQMVHTTLLWKSAWACFQHAT